MSTTAVASTSNRSLKFFEATIGKKVIMAVTGCILTLYVVGHMIGNLQVYLGAARLNHYAEFLHSLGAALWVIRLVLLTMVVVHIVVALQLWLANRAARPMNYKKQGWVQASLSSRTMIWTGPLVGLFVIFHILNLTTGQLHPAFNHELEVFTNVVTGFQMTPVSIIYILAMIVVGYHISHGIWSMFQSVGVNHPRLTPLLRRAAVIIAVVVAIGFISIPVSILAGIVQ